MNWWRSARTSSHDKNLNADFLMTNVEDKPFRVGWGAKFDKYSKELLTRYTNYFLFEFPNGYVTYRLLATSPEEDSLTQKLIKITSETSSIILNDFFGTDDTIRLGMRDVLLPCNPGKKLSLKKIKSLFKKYFSVPKLYIDYYPEYDFEGSEHDISHLVKVNKRKRPINALRNKSKRRVGRPRKLPAP